MKKSKGKTSVSKTNPSGVVPAPRGMPHMENRKKVAKMLNKKGMSGKYST